MASLAGILRFMGGIPGRMREAQYEHEPVYRERRESLDLGDDLGEADFPTGDLEPVGEKRTGKLSKFGKFTKEALPQILRGALVAAANPTPGKVGTAADIFGAIGAVGEDKQNRDMLAYKIERQLEQDNMDRRLNEAKARDYEAQADYNQWRTQQAVTGKQGKPIPPSKLDMYKEAFQYYKGRGYSDEDAHVEARSIALGTPSPELFNNRTPTTESAQRNAEYKKWSESQELRAKFPTFELYWESLGIGKSKAQDAGAVEGAKAEAKAPYFLRTLRGPDKYYQAIFQKGPAGKPLWNFVEAKTPEGLPIGTPKPSQRETASDRRLTREQTISSIVNRVLKEDTSGNPANALRNVQKFYQDDPEVQQYKAEVLARLQKLVQGEGTSKKAEQSIEVIDRSRARRQQKTKVEDLRNKYNY